MINKYPKKRDIISLNIEDNIGQTKKIILKIKNIIQNKIIALMKQLK